MFDFEFIYILFLFYPSPFLSVSLSYFINIETSACLNWSATVSYWTNSGCSVKEVDWVGCYWIWVRC